VWNFADIYLALDRADGAVEVADGDELGRRIAAWLGAGTARETTAAAALDTVEALSGARNRTLAALEPYLLQLRLHYRP
jgi:3-deoxy-D-manno-octulosonic-acid transferase